MQVDVLTAAHGAHARFVAAAWASLTAQSFTDWAWTVQVDGPAGPVLDALAACSAAEDDSVTIGVNDTSEGPAVTRNVALGRTRRPLAQNLDIDDQLEPDALGLLHEALTRYPTAGYAFGHARDLLASGTLRDHPLPLRPGLIRRGQLAELWTHSPDGNRLPVHPAGVMWRRTLVVALGGWPALHRMEDTGLLLAGSTAAPGVFVDQPVLRYRKHPGQLSAQSLKFSGGVDRSRSSANASPNSGTPPADAVTESMLPRDIGCGPRWVSAGGRGQHGVVKRGTAIGHPVEMAETATEGLGLRGSEIGWPLEEMWVSGDLLGPADTREVGSVVLVLDVPSEELPWLARHPAGEWVGDRLRLGKRPMLWCYRPLAWPAWNPDHRRLVRFWSAGTASTAPPSMRSDPAGSATSTTTRRATASAA